MTKGALSGDRLDTHERKGQTCNPWLELTHEDGPVSANMVPKKGGLDTGGCD